VRLKLEEFRKRGQNHSQIIAITRRMERSSQAARGIGLGEFVTSTGPKVMTKSMKKRLKLKAKSSKNEVMQRDTPTESSLQIRANQLGLGKIVNPPANIDQ